MNGTKNRKIADVESSHTLPQGTREGYPYHGRTCFVGTLVHGRDTPRGYPGVAGVDKWFDFALLFCLLLIVGGCSLTPDSSNGADPTLVPRATTPSQAINLTPQPTSPPLTDSQLVTRIVQNMSLDQKLGQMVIVEFYGATLNADLNQMIQGYHVSGVLIENKNGNAQSRSQLISLNQSMQKAASTPLFITTDFEGGLVNELRQITGERPSEQAIGATGNPTVAYNAGRSAASDLTSLGLNVNFMPIVDVLTNPNNPGLPQRTFGSDPTLVTNMGRAYLKGLTDGGVIGCLKHFPGLGSANLDPHLALPTMNRSLATLNAVDLVPYRTMIAEGIVPMVMVTHILNPQLDPQLPTSLSPNVVTGLLRKQLNFQGVIISDTLWMGGISNTYSLAQAAVLAIKAGTDLILGPRGLADTENMLYGMRQAVINGQISQSEIDASVTRILLMKMHYKVISHTQALQMARNAVSVSVGMIAPGSGAMVGGRGEGTLQYCSNKGDLPFRVPPQDTRKGHPYHGRTGLPQRGASMVGMPLAGILGRRGVTYLNSIGGRLRRLRGRVWQRFPCSTLRATQASPPHIHTAPVPTRFPLLRA